MKHTLLAVFLSFSVLAATVRADTVTMVNGKSFHGAVLSEEDGKVTLELEDGKVIELSRSMVKTVERNGLGKADAPAENATVGELMREGAALEARGKFDAAEQFYRAALAKRPEDKEAQQCLDDLALARVVYTISHPDAVRESGLIELRNEGERARRVIKRFIDEELLSLADWATEDKVRQLKLSLGVELRKRRDRLIDYVKDEGRYRNGPQGSVGQEEVNERMRAVRMLYTNPTDEAFLRQNDDYRAVDGALDVLREAWRACGGDDTTLRDMDDKRDIVRKALRAQIDFEAADKMRDGWAQVLAFNEKFPAEKGVLELARIMNDYRMSLGLPPLKLHDKLNLAAQGHSEEMFKENYFSHFSPHNDHRTPTQRIINAGYPLTREQRTGEVLTQGPRNAPEAMISWQESADHHRALIRPWWVDFGIGLKGDFWSVNFAVPKE